MDPPDPGGIRGRELSPDLLGSRGDLDPVDTARRLSDSVRVERAAVAAPADELIVGEFSRHGTGRAVAADRADRDRAVQANGGREGSVGRDHALPAAPLDGPDALGTECSGRSGDVLNVQAYSLSGVAAGKD